jgi:hypothetical protein
MTITIYGASDDLVEVDGAIGASPEEFNVYDSGKLLWRADFTDAESSGGTELADRLRVYAIYDGCWHFSVGQVDEDFKLPAWPVTITQANKLDGTPGYSALLTIEAPEGTQIGNVWPKTDSDEDDE